MNRCKILIRRPKSFALDHKLINRSIKLVEIREIEKNKVVSFTFHPRKWKAVKYSSKTTLEK